MYYQTGDVLYKSVNELPANKMKKVPGSLIHKGQNHHHTINGKFDLLEKEGVMFIVAKGKCQLLHEEHATVDLPKGIYLKEIVVEYDHFLEESRQVID